MAVPTPPRAMFAYQYDSSLNTVAEECNSKGAKGGATRAGGGGNDLLSRFLFRLDLRSALLASSEPVLSRTPELSPLSATANLTHDFELTVPYLTDWHLRPQVHWGART